MVFGRASAARQNGMRIVVVVDLKKGRGRDDLVAILCSLFPGGGIGGPLDDFEKAFGLRRSLNAGRYRRDQQQPKKGLKRPN